MKLRFLLISLITLAISCGEKSPKSNQAEDNSTQTKKIEEVVRAEGTPLERPKALETNADKALEYFYALQNGDGKYFRMNVSRYDHIQHNSNYDNGNVGYKKMVRDYISNKSKIDVYRLAEFDEHTIAHSVTTDSLGTSVGIDIMKFNNGQIAEHWYGRESQVTTEKTPDIQFNGSTAVTHDQNDAVRMKIAASFIRFIRLAGDMSKLKNLVGDNFKEHNPYLVGSSDPIGNYSADLKKKGIDQSYDELVTVFGGGNFVVTLSKGNRNGKAVDIYDLFRFDDLSIVEHWDVVN